MRHLYLAITLLLAVCPALFAQAPVIESVRNGDRRGEELSLGAIAFIQGENLSATPEQACSAGITTPWPTIFAPCNTMVLVNDAPAPLFSSSASQIRFQVPFAGQGGKGNPSPLEIVVDVDGERSEPFMVEPRRFSPAVPAFTGEEPFLGAFRANGALATLENRAMPGDTVTVRAFGVGPTNPLVPAGFAGSGEPLVAQPKVLIYGVGDAVQEAQVLSAVADPQPGSVIVEFILPLDSPMPIAPDSLLGVDLVIEDGGEVFTSQRVHLPVEAMAPGTGPVITSVRNHFSSEGELSPGAQAAISGQNLSASPGEECFSNEDPLPTIVSPCNAMVLVDGDPAPIIFNGDSFIRIQIPFDETAGKGPPSPIEIVVDVAGEQSPPVMVDLQRFAPALGLFFRLDGGEPVTVENRAVPGEGILVNAGGLGPTDPPVPTGFAGRSEAAVAQPKVLIQGEAKAVREAEVLDAVAFGRPGQYKVTFTLPDDLPMPIDPNYFYAVELVIEDGGEVFTSPRADLPVAVGEHQITGVLDAAGFQALISPGSIVSVLGNFVEITATASSIPLSENLNGFSVTFNDMPGALFGVFDGPFDQSNVQVPWNVDVSSGKVEVKVHWKDDTSEVWSDPFEVDAALASPGIYMFPPGTTQAIVTNFKQAGDDVIEGSWAQPSGSVDPREGQPAAIGGVVTLWCDGLGPVSPLPATGDIPASGTVPVTDKTVRVFVGGIEAQVLGAVLQPTSVGLNQINIIIPAGVTPGDAVPIVIEVECPDGTKLRSREDATIAVRAAP